MNSLTFKSSYRGSYGSAVANGRNRDCHEKATCAEASNRGTTFLYLKALGGSNEGGIGHVSLGVNFGLSEGTVTNYINHVSIKVHHVLEEFNPIVWPTAEERAAMKGLLIGFPEVIGFVDGKYQPLAAKGHDLTRACVRWLQTCAWFFYFTVDGNLWSLYPSWLQRGGGETRPHPI
jgi:hypothetical protein